MERNKGVEMFWKKSKDIDSAKQAEQVAPFPSNADRNHRINTKQLAEVQAQISVIEPMANRMLSEKVSFIGREELRPCYLLADLKRDEARLIFHIDEYTKEADDELKRLRSTVTGQNEKLQKALREYGEDDNPKTLVSAIKHSLEIFDIWGLHP